MQTITVYVTGNIKSLENLAILKASCGVKLLLTDSDILFMRTAS